MKFFSALTFFVSFCCFSGLMAEEPEAQTGKIRSFPAADWASADEAFLAANWSDTKLEKAEAKWLALQEKGQATGLMIVHQGFVIKEFGDCKTPVSCHSVRKSFLSAIYGAWIEKSGANINKLLSTKISEVPLTEIDGIPKRYQEATIRQLMQSSSGVPLPAEYESNRYFKERTQDPGLPGERFAYNNWDFNALGTVFHKFAEKDLFEAFDQSIAKPVGMQDFDREAHTEYYPGEGKEKKSLHPAYLFKLSARDRARLGLLYLSGGMWDGKRILSEDWFSRSVTDTIQVRNGPLDYGYMWWVGVGGQKQYEFPNDRTYSARGNGGQYIFVIPSRDLVIVHARDTRKGTEFDGKLFNEVFHAIADAQHVGALNVDALGFSCECETLIPSLQKEYKVPGVAMAVVDDGKVVWSREFGIQNADSGKAVTKDTLFEAASMSKPVFAYGVMKLVEQGKLDLNRPLVKYLAEPYMTTDDRHLKITARMALSHRTGFPNWRKSGYSLKTQPPALEFEPGTQYGYSGEGFTMLQKAVEEITELNIDQFTRQMILQPAGLKQSRFIWDSSAEIAAAHSEDGSFRRSNPRYLTGNSAYSMFTTANDYAKFLIEIMKADRSDGNSLSEETIRTMLTSQSEPGDERDYSLGWVIRPRHQGGYSHTGSNKGFRCGSWFNPESKRGVVIFTNAPGGAELCERLFEMALGSW